MSLKEEIMALAEAMKPQIEVFGPDEFTTTAAYVSVNSEYYYVKGYKSKIVEILNLDDTQSLKYKVLASIDKTNWHELKSETTLAKSTNTYESSAEPWFYFDVQVVDGDGHADGQVTVVGSTL